MADKTEAKQDKTLNELINGRIVDTIYIPRDNNALYQLEKLIAPASMTVLRRAEDCDTYDDRLDELKEQIKQSSDCLELCSLKPKEAQGILESLKTDDGADDSGDVDVAIKDTIAGKRFLASVVSLARPGEPKLHKWERDDQFWLDYLNDIKESAPSGFSRIFEKLDNMTWTAQRESKVLESIDFLS
jgi:hypothetical protein